MSLINLLENTFTAVSLLTNPDLPTTTLDAVTKTYSMTINDDTSMQKPVQYPNHRIDVKQILLNQWKLEEEKDPNHQRVVMPDCYFDDWYNAVVGNRRIYEKEVGSLGIWAEIFSLNDALEEDGYSAVKASELLRQNEDIIKKYGVHSIPGGTKIQFWVPANHPSYIATREDTLRSRVLVPGYWYVVDTLNKGKPTESRILMYRFDYNDGIKEAAEDLNEKLKELVENPKPIKWPKLYDENGTVLPEKNKPNYWQGIREGTVIKHEAPIKQKVRRTQHKAKNESWSSQRDFGLGPSGGGTHGFRIE